MSVGAWLRRHGPMQHPILYGTGALVVATGGGAIYVVGAAKLLVGSKVLATATWAALNKTAHISVIPAMANIKERAPDSFGELSKKIILSATAEAGKEAYKAARETISPARSKTRTFKVSYNKEKIEMKKTPVKLASQLKRCGQKSNRSKAA